MINQILKKTELNGQDIDYLITHNLNLNKNRKVKINRLKMEYFIKRDKGNHKKEIKRILERGFKIDATSILFKGEKYFSYLYFTREKNLIMIRIESFYKKPFSDLFKWLDKQGTLMFLNNALKEKYKNFNLRSIYFLEKKRGVKNEKNRS